jgi:hypothetical protein
MIPYLTKSEINQYADEIRSEFERLLRHPQLKGRKATQWDFLRHCFNVVMGDESGDFKSVKRSAVKDYSFEISAKLRNYYSRPHEKPVRFKFKIEGERRKTKIPDKLADYSSANGYSLRIIPTDPELKTTQQTRDILSRVIDDAIHTVFDLYSRLPIESSVLLKECSPILESCYDRDGAPYKQILADVERHHKKGEIISNAWNPSTRPQLRSLELKELDEQSARVSVSECWNLHWFSTRQKVYTYIYHGQNQQYYTLVKHDNRWLIQENLYRRPRGAVT